MEKKVIEALRKVIDPELGVNIVDLGLVYKIKTTDGKVYILMTLTSPGCPLSFVFEDLIRGALSKVRGVKDIKIELTFEPLWSPEKMTKEARLKVGI